MDSLAQVGTDLANSVYIIAFGGNTGDREACARGALDSLNAFGRIGRQSNWYHTPPLQSEIYDTTGHAEYLNFVFEFFTTLPPQELYAEICKIEDCFGHDRQERWRPRAVDLDLLFWAQCPEGCSRFNSDFVSEFIGMNSTLQIPHPEIWKRDFLLKMIKDDLNIDLDTFSSSSPAREKDN